MSASHRGADAPATETSRRPPAQARPGSGGSWRGHSRLRLVGARRGDGVLVWSGVAIPVTYELDVFTLGPIRSIQGALEGEFSRLVSRGLTRLAQTGGLRLRLDDGREIDIELVELGASFAEFNASDASAGADLLA